MLTFGEIVMFVVAMAAIMVWAQIETFLGIKPSRKKPKRDLWRRFRY